MERRFAVAIKTRKKTNQPSEKIKQQTTRHTVSQQNSSQPASQPRPSTKNSQRYPDLPFLKNKFRKTKQQSSSSTRKQQQIKNDTKTKRFLHKSINLHSKKDNNVVATFKHTHAHTRTPTYRQTFIPSIKKFITWIHTYMCTYINNKEETATKQQRKIFVLRVMEMKRE